MSSPLSHRQSALGRDRSKSAVSVWLLALALAVLVQVLLGGVTRLSESGLSIMEWAPIMGVLPPLNEAEWRRIFEIYRQTGEFRLENAGLDLAGFKSIFWWEYAHRLWARGIVFAFLLPYAWFWFKGRLTVGWRWRLACVFVLGGLQGLMGWIMVESGFSNRTDVSQYRLVAHLMLALLIFALLLWSALSIKGGRRLALDSRLSSLRPLGWIFVALLTLQIALGGFVAGMDAGLIYNTFPLMGERLVPIELGAVSPWWLDPFENPASAQFLHRAMAAIVVVAGLALGVAAFRRGDKSGAAWLSAFILLQVGLGIATLLLMVPISLAVSHQAIAFALIAWTLTLLHRWSRGFQG